MEKDTLHMITNLGNDSDKLMVQKSWPLFALWKSEMSLAEFKILDTYLSRIDSHKPDMRTVVFKKEELEKLLGIKKINNKDLENRLKNLMKNIVKIPDDETKKGYRLITLFEEAYFDENDEGVYQVKLECTQKAMKYIFNIDAIGYLKYRLKCITSITSRYSYIMFLYLESNRYRKTWEIEVDELKKILVCDQGETYKEYKHFNNLILKKTQKELHEKTKLEYSYEPIKKGRTVKAIKFTITTLSDMVELVKPVESAFEKLKEENINELWENVFIGENEKSEFSTEEIEEIKQIIVTIPDYILPEDVTTNMNDISIRRYHYVAQKYATLNRMHSEKKIKNRFAYFLKMIKQDAKSA